jgi:hypothetical protein
MCAVLDLAFAALRWLPNVGAVMFAMFLAMFVSSGFLAPLLRGLSDSHRDSPSWIWTLSWFARKKD